MDHEPPIPVFKYMHPAGKFIIFQVMILIPFSAGFLVRRRTVSTGELSVHLIRLNLIFFEPMIVLWSIWGLHLDLDLLLLPFSGLLLVGFGALAGKGLSPLLALPKKPRATFLVSASLANHGFTLGGFLCYLLLGEKGLGLASVFISYFMLYIFLVVFPYAQTISEHDAPEAPGLREMFINIRNMPLYAVFLAVILHLAGIGRPAIPFPVDILLAISIGLYYFIVGINFQFQRGRFKIRENLLLAAIKFLLVPLFAVLLIRITGLTGTLARVILVESFMPAATYSVVTATLFDLDSELASVLFVGNTVLFLFLVLPLILGFIPGLFG